MKGLKIFVPITFLAILVLFPVKIYGGTLFFVRRELISVTLNSIYDITFSGFTTSPCGSVHNFMDALKWNDQGLFELGLKFCVSSISPECPMRFGFFCRCWSFTEMGALAHLNGCWSVAEMGAFTHLNWAKLWNFQGKDEPVETTGARSDATSAAVGSPGCFLLLVEKPEQSEGEG
ncbi:hypothetical protein MRB53_019185 [Persea americana]|uniref:Uncharacterized protein n=1 Tax=Persea americana TaxID=3435 RepID=A0ACC2KXM7_PERAE|nr:hypothetical protein MRB53_019185 [Persea americana]